VIVYSAAAAAITAYVAWFASANWGYLSAGAFLGGLTAMWIVFPELADGPSARLADGAFGEEETARELRRLRRDGWRAVHNVYFESGDVDHVAIGPGGVVVIETKSSTGDWKFLVEQGWVSAWGRQARGGRDRIRALIKQRSGDVVSAVPLVVTWVAGQPEAPYSISDEVIAIRGIGLRDHLRSLPKIQEADQIERIASALSAAAQQTDERIGVRHPGLIGRMFGS
jgi:hypothetical protein